MSFDATSVIGVEGNGQRATLRSLRRDAIVGPRTIASIANVNGEGVEILAG